MKAIKKYSAIVSALITPTAFAQIDVSLEYLNWTADTNKLAYVVNDLSGSVIPADIIEGNIQSIEGDSDDGARISASWKSDDNGEVTLRYTDFSSVSEDSLTGTDLFGIRYHSDQSVDIGEPFEGSASSKLEFDYSSFDLEYSYSLEFGNSGQIKPFVGISYVEIEQQLTSNYIEDTDIVNVKEQADTDAFGLRFGADASWSLTDTVNLMARASITVYTADLSGGMLETEVDDDPVVTNVDTKFDETGSMTDTAVSLGIGWDFYERDNLALSTALVYEVHSINGAAGFARFPDDVNDATILLGESDINLNGFSLSISGSF